MEPTILRRELTSGPHEDLPEQKRIWTASKHFQLKAIARTGNYKPQTRGNLCMQRILSWRLSPALGCTVPGASQERCMWREAQLPAFEHFRMPSVHRLMKSIEPIMPELRAFALGFDHSRLGPLESICRSLLSVRPVQHKMPCNGEPSSSLQMLQISLDMETSGVAGAEADVEIPARLTSTQAAIPATHSYTPAAIGAGRMLHPVFEGIYFLWEDAGLRSQIPLLSHNLWKFYKKIQLHTWLGLHVRR